MSAPIYGSRQDGVDPAFPGIVDDAAPERNAAPDPQVAALPGDQYLGANARGTTVEEQLEGEDLTSKLEREEPEPDPYAPVPAESDKALDQESRLLSDPEGIYPGRLVEPDEGAHPDTEADAVAGEAFSGENDLSPEELAMHIEPEPGY